MLLSIYNVSKNSAIFDNRFLYYLVGAILKTQQRKMVTKEKKTFIRDIFNYRLRGASDRVERANNFDSLIKMVTKEIHEKNEKMKPRNLYK